MSLITNNSASGMEIDFNLPQTAIEYADNLIDLSKKQKPITADTMMLRGVMIKAKAMSYINNDDINQVMSLMQQSYSKMQTPLGQGLLSLACGIELQKIYNSRSGYYDNVSTPVEPLPELVSEWNGKQFKAQIGKYFDKAIECSVSPLFDMPIEDATEFIEPTDSPYITTLRDFVNIEVFNNYYIENDVKQTADFAGRVAHEFTRLSAKWFFWKILAIKPCKVNPRALPFYEDVVDEESNPAAGLLNFYKEYADVEEARQVLVSYARGSIINIPEAVALIRKSLKEFPNCTYNDALENKLAMLTRPVVNISCPNIVAPNHEFKVKITHSWSRSIGFELYTVAESKLVERVITYSTDSDPDAYQADTIMNLTLPKAGMYALVPLVNNEKTDADWVYSVITCSEFVPIIFDNTKTSAVVAASTVDGAPVKGVTVKGIKGMIDLGSTAEDGIMRIHRPINIDTRLKFIYKGQARQFDRDFYVNGYTRGYGSYYRVNIYTDRPIYRPGQTVEWALIAMHSDMLEKDTKLFVKMYDANHQLVDTMRVKTDAMGCASGKFDIPSDGLTGYFTIVVEGDKFMNGIRYGQCIVCVSDFRMPTFYLEPIAVERDVPAKGDVTLRGKAMTYSGMPVTDAKVNVNISSTFRWRWFATQDFIGELNGTTDKDGNFEIIVPADMTSKSTLKDFIAKITVTDKANETSDASRFFTTGKPYALYVEFDERKFNLDTPIASPVRVYDANGDDAELEVKWRLLTKADSTLVASGSYVAGKPDSKIDLSFIPVGNYILEVEPENADMANKTSAQLMLYSLARNEVPEFKGIFWIGADQIETDAEGKAEITFGVAKDTYIYIGQCSGGDLNRIELQHFKKGFNKMSFNIPEKFELSSVQVAMVTGGETHTYNLMLRKPDRKEVKLSCETFRDNLMPGSPETWKFRFENVEGKPVCGEMIATMFSKALLQLNSLDWNTNVRPRVVYPSMSIKHTWFGSFSSEYQLNVESKSVKSYFIPSFRFMPGFYFDFIVGSYYEGFAKSRHMVMNSMASFDGAMTEDIEEERDDDSSMAAGAQESAMPEPENEMPVYRDADVMQAFWRPAVSIGEDGQCEISFIVPNANTTWRLNAFAWSGDMHSSTFSADVLANKPIMVQPTLPRYLRQGDSARVAAKVFNNTDSTQMVETFIDIFDTTTGNILSSSYHRTPIEANQSVVVGIDVEAPTDVATIGYRIRSSANGYTDGEQSAIPILEAATTIVDATTFYLNPGEESITLTVPDSPDMATTLQYCQNPIWTVVKAMREIPAKSYTSTGAVNNLFTALVAKHLYEKYPAIERTLKVWHENPDDSAMVSMLERNGDLKVLDLDKTPWIQTAANQTARMQALDNVFNERNLKSAIKKSLKTLRDHQTKSGGFFWGEWSKEPSLWATENVLITIGLAHSLGAMTDMDSDLIEMVDRAYRWYANELKEATFELLQIEALLPFVNKVSRPELDREALLKEYTEAKSLPTITKAWLVLILKSQKKPVGYLMRSLREYAVMEPGKGLSFPSINDIRGYATIIQAFAEADPRTDELDAMRQWVILRQQANDDFGAFACDYIIASILLTGSDWTDIPTTTSVLIDGKPLEIDKVEAASGYFSQKIRNDIKGATVTIGTNGVTPSYGSLVSIGRRPMAEIEARPGNGLSIDKRLVVMRDNEWVEPETIHAGERVRVLLTLRVDDDMEYVTIVDDRAACLDPVDQLSGYVNAGGAFAYRENRNSATNFFINYLPKGVYQISYDMTAIFEGTFAGGPATVQSEYAPELTARSGARLLRILP